ncbi:CvpA family protein [Variovorax sp. LjRoot290]|uniref:CvpA family protein n=1 Tax=Variovorax sp. LjRoot290 TaxID=3342316 RepID=UPI003F5183BC
MDFVVDVPSALNGIDLLLLLIVSLGVWPGWRRGFLRCAAELAAFVAAVLIALWCSLPAASYLDRWGLVEDPWAAPAGFLILLVLGRVLLDALVWRWVAFSARVAGSNVLDRSMGVLPGAVTGLVNAAVVAMVLLAAPFGNGVNKSAQKHPGSQAGCARRLDRSKARSDLRARHQPGHQQIHGSAAGKCCHRAAVRGYGSKASARLRGSDAGAAQRRAAQARTAAAQGRPASA